MARKQSARGTGKVAPKLKGKTVAFTGKVNDSDVDRLTKLVLGEGGQLVRGVTASLGYLVLVGWAKKGRQADAREAERLNRKEGASIRILPLQDFYRALSPDRDEALALLRAGANGVDRWNRLREFYWNVPLDLAGADLGKARLQGANLQYVTLDGADLRGADLTQAALTEVRGARLDDACLASASVPWLTDCSLCRADLTEASINQAQYRRCDFTGASLRQVAGYYARITECVFTDADLRGAY